GNWPSTAFAHAWPKPCGSTASDAPLRPPTPPGVAGSSPSASEARSRRCAAAPGPSSPRKNLSKSLRAPLDRAETERSRGLGEVLLEASAGVSHPGATFPFMGVAEALERVVAALPGGGEARSGQLEMAD